MVINHLFDDDRTLSLDGENQAHLAGQPKCELPTPFAGERVQVECANLVEVSDAVGGDQRCDALHVPASDVRVPSAGRFGASFERALKLPRAEPYMHTDSPLG